MKKIVNYLSFVVVIFFINYIISFSYYLYCMYSSIDTSYFIGSYTFVSLMLLILSMLSFAIFDQIRIGGKKKKRKKQVSDYIEESMKRYSMNIDEFEIGQTMLDSDGEECEITNKTKNTIQVLIKRKTKEGVNAYQWFNMKSFNKRFKILAWKKLLNK